MGNYLCGTNDRSFTASEIKNAIIQYPKDTRLCHYQYEY